MLGGNDMNNMRTPFEKEKILKEYYEGKTFVELSNKYNVERRLLYSWLHKYESNGITGLKSNTGKKTGGTKGQGPRKPKSYEEELEMKIMKLEIENARLKKGYTVKGGGDQKEYVTILEKNTK